MGLSNFLPSSRIAQSGVIPDTASRPASPYEGQMLYQKDTNQVLVWDGSAWVMIADTDQPPSLQLIKTATVTNAADTGTTWDDVFTDDYSSYKLVVSSVNAHTNGSVLRLQFRYAGPTTQALTYYSGFVAPAYDASSLVRGINNGTHIRVNLATSNDSRNSGVFEFTQVRSATLNPSVTFQFVDGYSGAFALGGGYANTQRAYTGFLFSMDSGNISVTGSLYGYRK